MPWSNNAIAKPSGAGAPSGVAVDTNGDWLLLDYYDGVYRSTDDGANWTLIGKPSGAGAPSGVAVDTNGDWLLLDYYDGVYRSTDDGANWTLIGKPSGAGAPSGVAVDTNGDWLLLDSADGVYRSTDDGATWTLIGKPAGASAPRGLAVDTNGDWLLLDYADGVYRSTDDGANWTLIGKPSGAISPQGMAVDTNGDWLLLDNYDGVYRYLSAQAAATVSAGAPTASATVQAYYVWAQAAARVRAGKPSVSVTVQASTGTPWSTTKISLPSGVNNARGLAVARNGNLLLIDAPTDGIYVSTDGGATWGNKIGLPSAVNAPRGLAIDLNDNWLFVDGTTDGLYRSSDNGATWSNKINLPTGMVNPSGLAVDRNGDLIVVGYTLDQLHVSADGGATWTFLNSLPSGVGHPSGLSVAQNGDLLLIAEDTDTLYVSRDRGATWSVEIDLPAGVTQPRGVAVDTNGDFLVTDASTDFIYRYLAAQAAARVRAGKPSVSATVQALITQRYVLEIDWDGDGNFANAHADVYPDLLSCIARRGRDYGSMLYGKSIAGILRATLRNDDHKYSRFNALSPLHNLVTPGRKVRLRIAPPGDSAYTTIWGGTLFEIDPQPRTGGNDEVRLIAYGPLADFTQRDVSVAMQAPAGGITVADAAGLVFTAAGFPTGSRGPVGGNRRMSRWWSPTQQAIKALRELEDTELGFLKETKDGKPALESENARLVGGGQTPQGTLTDDNSGTLPVVSLELVDPVKDIVNIVNVPVRTYQTGSVEVLWQLRETITLEPNESLTIKAEYPGPNATRGAIGVQSWETLTATTDYTANTSADGTGTDVTARLSITTSDTATTRELSIRNTDTAAALVVTKLQCRGTAVIEGEPVVVVHKDQDSIDAYGEKAYLTPSQFISDIRDGLSYAGYLVSVLKAPQVKGNAVVDLTDHPTVARDLDLSDRMTLKTGGQYEDQFVEAIEHRLGTRGRHHAEVMMSPAEVFENVIVLDVGPGLGTGALGR